MKYKLNNQWVDINIKALDSMPVGTQVEYTGEDIPTGWEEVNDYSTTEIDTGKKWIDGKPIYRKVITMQNQAVAQVSVGAISNMDSVVSLNGILISSEVKNVMGSHNDDSNYASRLYMYGNEIFYQQGTGWRSTSYTIQVIIEYTKTTD